MGENTVVVTDWLGYTEREGYEAGGQDSRVVGRDSAGGGDAATSHPIAGGCRFPPGNQQITSLWNGTYTQSGASVTVRNADWNGTIPANGGTVSFGFNANYSGTNAKPTAFTLNGVSCTVQ